MSDPHLSRLPVVKAPDSIWNSIEASLANPAPERPRSPRWIVWMWVPASVLVLAIGFGFWSRLHRTRWEVVRATGSESVSAGDFVQTDARSTAEVRVGAIGTVEISPGTRLRILATKQNDNRLSLEHGEIAATISAPPKLFFVETKSATAVDLGCEYKMKVDDAGNGLLRVTRGWVAFDWQGRESLVPAGASCRTRAGVGPGTPFFEDASPELRSALDAFDFANGGEDALRAILASAKSHDTLTLWHLLARVPASLRPIVYDRMVSFASPPAGVTRDKALTLDPSTLKMWKDELAWTW